MEKLFFQKPVYLWKHKLVIFRIFVAFCVPAKTTMITTSTVNVARIILKISHSPQIPVHSTSGFSYIQSPETNTARMLTDWGWIWDKF